MVEKHDAFDWIDSDPHAIRDDIARLGIDGAVDYQLELIADRESMGDDRWSSITVESMRDALTSFST